jgi:hypothetical protein
MSTASEDTTCTVPTVDTVVTTADSSSISSSDGISTLANDSVNSGLRATAAPFVPSFNAPVFIPSTGAAGFAALTAPPAAVVQSSALPPAPAFVASHIPSFVPLPFGTDRSSGLQPVVVAPAPAAASSSSVQPHKINQTIIDQFQEMKIHRNENSLDALRRIQSRLSHLSAGILFSDPSLNM